VVTVPGDSQWRIPISRHVQAELAGPPLDVGAMVQEQLREQAAGPPTSAAGTLGRVDAAIDGRCPCGADPRPGSTYCSPDCEPTHRGPDTDAPWLGGPHAARWRPDLVTAFDDSGLELVQIEERGSFTRRTYRRAGSDQWWFRLDDGHRFVGVDVSAEVVREWEGRDRVWYRLERELGDRRRLDPEPAVDAFAEFASAFGASVSQAAEGFNRLARQLAEAYEAEEGEWAVLDGRVDPRAAGTVFWMPDPPADPEAPTLAELAGGIDLTPYVAHPTATWVDETRRVDWSVLRRVMGPADQLRVGDRISVEWSTADGRRDATQLRVAEIRPDGAAVTEPVDRSGMAERFRRLGEQVSDPHGYGLAAAGGFQRLVAAAVQAESDRVALRTVCADEEMYQAALAAAGERGWSAARMFAAVAEGRYTEHGWTGPQSGRNTTT
jgi:hypothetical protein